MDATHPEWKTENFVADREHVNALVAQIDTRGRRMSECQCNCENGKAAKKPLVPPQCRSVVGPWEHPGSTSFVAGSCEKNLTFEIHDRTNESDGGTARVHAAVAPRAMKAVPASVVKETKAVNATGGAKGNVDIAHPQQCAAKNPTVIPKAGISPQRG